MAMVQRILTIILVTASLFSIVNASCSNVLDIIPGITETTENGTVLLNSTKTPNDTVAFEISDTTPNLESRFYGNLTTYFHLYQEPTYFTLQIAKTLDLEAFHLNFNKAVLTTIALVIHCTDTPFVVTIPNTPVNEFKPQFQNAPFNTSVSENTTVKSTVFYVDGKVEDHDIPTPGTFYYTIVKHTIQEADGKDLFDIHNTNGQISLTKPLDYDYSGLRTMFLNISVADGSGSDKMTSYTDLKITLLNSDDQDPYFDWPNCSMPCVAPPYTATITLNDDALLDVKPVPIKGADPDGLGTALLFSIESGNTHDLFTINTHNGDVGMSKSVAESGLKDPEFRLVLQVRKNLPNIELASIAILRVIVFERIVTENGTMTPITPRTVIQKSDNSLLIPVIILGIILFLLIIAIVIVVLIIRNKQKQMTVKPDNSEPQTEEEDIHSDRSDAMNSRAFSNERLVFDGKVTIGIGTDGFPETPAKKRGLPPLPLKDTATETEGEVHRKKRSRKRNKKKEPEIFDGTREYNMGADPEFFDSSEKSKVKRSQRSYDKKSDPSSWITVPNDQPIEKY